MPRCPSQSPHVPTSRRRCMGARGATTCRPVADRRRATSSSVATTTGTWNTAPATGAHDLRVERVDRSGRQHHGLNTRRLGRTQDRAEVAGSASDRQPPRSRGARWRHRRLGHPDNRQVRLRAFGRRHPLEHAVGEFEPRRRLTGSVPGATNSPRSSQPAETASPISTAPSTTNAASSERELRRPKRRRSR